LLLELARLVCILFSHVFDGALDLLLLFLYDFSIELFFLYFIEGFVEFGSVISLPGVRADPSSFLLLPFKLVLEILLSSKPLSFDSIFTLDSECPEFGLFTVHSLLVIFVALELLDFALFLVSLDASQEVSVRPSHFRKGGF